jgi:hypothetical protein
VSRLDDGDGARDQEDQRQASEPHRDTAQL